MRSESPSRLKGIETYRSQGEEIRRPECSENLSRLKGIETVQCLW